MHLEEVRNFWAKVLGVRGPHWMIIMALQDLDQGDGVPVETLATTLQVDPTFVTSQSQLLEKRGFIRREVSDRGVVILSLTDTAYEHLAKLASEFDPREN